MTRLFEYIDDYTPLLMEKVNKKEITSMLKSTDIFVGAEFEFYADDLSGNGINDVLQDDYYNALTDWQQYNDGVIKYQNDYEELNDEILKLDGKIDEIEDEIAELEDEIERLGYLDYDELSGELIIKHKNEIEELKKKKSKLKDKMSDFEDEIEELYFPVIGVDYHYYMEQIGWYSHVEPGEEADQPISPEEVNDENENESDIYSMEEWIKNVHPQPPFKNYNVGDYHDHMQTIDSKNWVIENDTSLSDNPGGIEIKSPPMSLKDFVKICPKMFNWIKEVGNTNGACGFHIHMSLKGVSNLKNQLDLMKLVLFTDEQYIYKFFKDREDILYARPMRKKIDTGTLDQQDWDKFIDTKKLRRLVTADHYSGINIESIEEGHIEFRYLGAADYHRKWNKIQIIIAQYAYNLNLACNPLFKQKEYITKTRRLFNKKEQEIMVRIHKAFDNLLKFHKKHNGSKKGEMFLKKSKKNITFKKIGNNGDWKQYIRTTVIREWYKIEGYPPDGTGSELNDELFNIFH